ncbi:hypothetical protein V1520DRAFT_338506 [Lipomyces starkeyi]|uniref:Uncharacterized protein n=1 Tax=Lipomyces starkeyi NRRL Y-11557 TaxID=675824 RepID=A0A1E3PXR9_LIPST|nr:hypothetical protein LIPSTDRAFT_30062 [Lipomyces starkeyi NRRL Y-11557]
MPYSQLQLDSNTPIDGLLVFFYSRVIKYGYNVHAVTRRLKAKLTTIIVPYREQQDRDVRDVIAGSTCATTVDSSIRVRRRLCRRSGPEYEESCARSSDTVGGTRCRSRYHDAPPVSSPKSSLQHRIGKPYTTSFTTSDRSRASSSLMDKRKYRRCSSILSMLSFRSWSVIFKESILRYNPEEYDAFLKGTSVDDYRRQAAQIYRVMPLEKQPDTKSIQRKSFKRRLLGI